MTTHELSQLAGLTIQEAKLYLGKDSSEFDEIELSFTNGTTHVIKVQHRMSDFAVYSMETGADVPPAAERTPIRRSNAAARRSKRLAYLAWCGESAAVLP